MGDYSRAESHEGKSVLATGRRAARAAQTMDFDRDAIAELHNRWLAAELRGDHAGLAAMCCEDAVVAPPDAPPIIGRAAIEDFLAQSQSPIAEIRIEDLGIDLAPQLAVKRARFATRLVGDDQVYRGTHFWVLRPRWLISYLTWALEST